MNQNEPLSIDPKLFTVSEVATFFRCDPETVKRQARNGKLPGFKFGKSWFFRLQDINGMIDTAIHAAHLVQA
jgi:excisionase family DNA binding protein